MPNRGMAGTQPSPAPAPAMRHNPEVGIMGACVCRSSVVGFGILDRLEGRHLHIVRHNAIISLIAAMPDWFTDFRAQRVDEDLRGGTVAETPAA